MGLLGVNNIHVDGNLNVRSIERLQLPDEKETKKSQFLIPSPSMNNQFTRLEIAKISNVEHFRFIITDVALKFQLNVGEVKPQKESPLFSILSQQGSVNLQFYGSVQGEDTHIKSWMQVFIDLLEKLPPTNFGLFIESLRHIQSLIKVDPTPFHINLIKTILVSQDIFFEQGPNITSKGDLITMMNENYGGDSAYDIAVLLDKIEKSPELPLIDFIKMCNTDIITLIYLILILEQEDAIIVRRPNFITFE